MKSLKPAYTKWILTGSLFLVLGFNLSIHQFPKDEHGFALIHSRDLPLDMNREAGVIDLASRDPAEDAKKTPAVAGTKGSGPKAPAVRPVRKAGKGSTAGKAAGKGEVKDADAGKGADLAGEKPEVDTQAAKKAEEAAAAKQKEAEEKERQEKAAKQAAAAKESTQSGKSDEKPQVFSGKIAEKEALVILTGDQMTITFPGCSKCESLVQSIPKAVTDLKGNSSEIFAFLNKEAEAKKLAKEKTAEERKAEQDELFAKIKEECAVKADTEKQVEELTCRKDKLIALFKEKGKKKTTGREDEKKEANKDKIDKSKFVKFFKIEVLNKIASTLQSRFKKGDSDDRNETLEAAMTLMEDCLSELPSEMEESRKGVVKLYADIVNNAGANVQRVRIAQNGRVIEQQARAKANGQTYDKNLDTTYQVLDAEARRLQNDARNLSLAAGEHLKFGLEQYFDGNPSSDSRKYFEYMTAFGNNNLRINQALLNPTDSRYSLSEIDLMQSTRFGFLDQSGYNLLGSNGNDGLVSPKASNTTVGSNPRLLTKEQARRVKANRLPTLRRSGNGTTLGAATIGTTSGTSTLGTPNMLNSGLTLNNNQSAFGGPLYKTGQQQPVLLQRTSQSRPARQLRR